MVLPFSVTLSMLGKFGFDLGWFWVGFGWALESWNNIFFSDYEESALDRVLQSAFALSDGAGKITFDLNDMIDYTSEDFYR